MEVQITGHTVTARYWPRTLTKDNRWIEDKNFFELADGVWSATARMKSPKTLGA